MRQFVGTGWCCASDNGREEASKHATTRCEFWCEEGGMRGMRSRPGVRLRQMMQAVGYELGFVVICIVGGATIPRCKVNSPSPQRQCHRLHGHRHAFLPKQQGIGEPEPGRNIS